MFAVSAPGLEKILGSEIDALGVSDSARVDGGVTFGGELAQLYEANLWLRTASRVVVRVDEFHADSFHELERRAKRIRWEEYLRPGARVRFRVTCRKSRLYHSDAVAERFAEAAAHRVNGVTMAGATGEAADDDETGTVEESAQLFVVRLSHDNCVVSADSSGTLLHRRGYRQAIGKAPLRETLAAAMVMGSGWDRRAPLIDPLCGSGTIAIESAMIARRIPPGIRRGFAFQQWPSYDAPKWESVLEKASESGISASTSAILASDRDDGVVEMAKGNTARAGVTNDIEIKAQAISAVQPPNEPGWIVTNPPYGVRVGERGPLRNLYAELGKLVRLRAKGYTLGLLSADPVLESMLQLRLEEVFRTRNGGIPVRLMKGSAA